jgi:twinkle protein
MTSILETLAANNIRLRNTAAGSHKTTCPQCSHTRKGLNQKDPCLSVTIRDDGDLVFLCHHCGWAGGKEKAVSGQAHGFQQERKIVVKREPIKLPDNRQLTPMGEEWFLDRGIHPDTARHFGIWHNDERKAIHFPYFRKGEIVNVKSRTHDKKFRQVSGAEKIYYGLDDIAAHETVIIVEGEIDKLTLHQAGFPNCVSVPDGAPNQVKETVEEGERKFSFVANCWQEFEGKQIILAVDSDQNGKNLAEELSRRYGKERCKVVTWPDGCKDANEVYYQFGPDAVQECIDNARPYPVKGLSRFKDTIKNASELREKAFKPTVSTGWKAMDEFYRIPSDAGYLHIVTGIPNHGKSEFLDSLLMNLAEQHGWTFALCSFENPIEDHLEKLCGKKLSASLHDNPNMSDEQIDAAIDFIDKHFLLIREETGDEAVTFDWVLDKARIAAGRDGIRGLVIDPYNYIETMRPSSMTESEFISKVLSKLKQFAMTYRVHVWVVAHPVKQEDEIKPKRPGLYSISGSAHWFNKADFGLTVHRTVTDEGRDITQVHILKVRFQPKHGKKGVVNFVFRPNQCRHFIDFMQHPA